MRYLCLIYYDEKVLRDMPENEMEALNAEHLAFNDGILESGHFIEAEALQPVSAATCVRVRNGKAVLSDGPFAETKEMVAGFYLIEARDLNESIQVAARIPSASRGTVEIRPCRDLEVAGVPQKASRKTR